MKKSAFFPSYGLFFWLITLLWHWPFGLEQVAWVELLLLLHVLLLARFALHTDDRSRSINWELTYALAATAFGVAYWLPKGWLAATLVTPWLIFVVAENRRLWQAAPLSFHPLDLLRKAAYLFWIVGIAWAFADRLGWRPLGFSPTLVLLTAVHFHYAGLLLPLIAHWALEKSSSSQSKLLALALIFGIPMVAIGITSTKLGGPFWIETLAATWMGLAGMALAFLHVVALKFYKDFFIKMALFVGASALLVAMLLAIAYGWNPILGWTWLTIPWMYAVHGSLNAFGVGIALLGAWFWIKKAQ